MRFPRLRTISAVAGQGVASTMTSLDWAASCCEVTRGAWETGEVRHLRGIRVARPERNRMAGFREAAAERRAYISCSYDADCHSWWMRGLSRWMRACVNPLDSAARRVPLPSKRHGKDA